MKSSRPGPLWKLSVAAEAEAADAIANLLLELSDRPPVTFTDIETSQTSISVYPDRKPAAAMLVTCGPVFCGSSRAG